MWSDYYKDSENVWFYHIPPLREHANNKKKSINRTVQKNNDILNIF